MGNNKSIYLVCRLSIAFVWLYHGLVPKLLGPHADEISMNMAIGFSESQAVVIAYIGGVGEILFGALILLFWKHRWPLLLSAIFIFGLLCFSMIFVPKLALAAFNPVTTNVTVIALSLVAYWLHNAQTKDYEK